MQKKILLLIIVLSLNYSFLYCQTNKSWTWNSYKITLQAPSDFVVKESSPTFFHAGNGNLFLSIYPKKGENLTYDRMQQASQSWAIQSKVTFTSSDSGYLPNLNRFWSYYIKARDYKAMPTYILLLVDPGHVENSYYVWLQYKSGYEATALNVLKSFSHQ